jgi:hypothetical protein
VQTKFLTGNPKTRDHFEVAGGEGIIIIIIID